jgi:uncharacterized membrane protein YfcA
MRKRKNGGRGSRALAACLAGLFNGLLGTGGGIPLCLALSREGADREAYATSSVGVLLLSLQTVLLYRGGAVPLATVSPFLPFAAVTGGALGALLLSRISLGTLRLFFGGLLLLSGCYVGGKELYLALA